MRKYLPKVSLWLFVTNLGTAFSAGISTSPGSSSLVAEHCAAGVAQHWPGLLGLRDDGAPHAAHARQSGRCLARSGT